MAESSLQAQIAPAASAAPLVRLPGRASSWNEWIGFSSSLWLGEEWLLLVDSHLLRDEYRRFYFRDIQALQMRRTARGLIYNLGLGALAGFSALIAALASSGNRGGRLFWAVVAVGAFIALVVNLLRGPTCRCVLQTATSRLPLRSLSRVKAAQRAFARLRERIAAAQGGLLPPEEAVERLNQHLAGAARQLTASRLAGSPIPAAAGPPPVSASPPPPPPPPLSPAPLA